MTAKPANKEMIRPIGLGAQVAETLMLAILEGEYKGGDQLVELELQESFGVSRSPLREAFRELEKKGLVEIIPRRGTFVKKTTRRDIEENFPMRAALEGLAAQLAVRHMDDSSLAGLASELSHMEAAAHKSDIKTYYTHHLAFHELFINLCGNHILIDTLQTLRMQNMWHRFSYKYYREDLGKSLDDHKKIYQAFSSSSCDPAQCRQLVEDHINIALDRFLEYLNSSEK